MTVAEAERVKERLVQLNLYASRAYGQESVGLERMTDGDIAIDGYQHS